MKPPPFRYLAARSLDHALDVLAAEGGEARILAGGQSLMPMLNFRLVRPSVLVDINRIDGLAGIRQDGGTLRIGAVTRHAALEASPLVRRHCPIVAAAMQHVAHLAVRNRGTIGGSLSHADPAAELPMLACLLDARIHSRSISAARIRNATDFFVAPLVTALQPDEMVTAIELPLLPAGTGWGFEECARRHGDFALACVAVTLSARDGRMCHVRVGMMGVGETPLRAPAAEAALEDRPCDEAALAEAAQAVCTTARPGSDLHASADYRRHLVGVLARRAIAAAWQRAIATGPRAIAAAGAGGVARAGAAVAGASSVATAGASSVATAGAHAVADPAAAKPPASP